MHYIFRNNYGFNYAEIVEPAFTNTDLNFLLRVNKYIRGIGGHCLRPHIVGQLFGTRIQHITFLRDPTDRFISHYNHGRHINKHRMSLEERCENLSEADYQTKFIIGFLDSESRNFTAVKQHLEQAKQVLQNDYSFIGIVERFDESLLLMKAILGLKDFDIRYQRKNITRQRTHTKEKISSNLLNKLERVNQIDLELYRFVKHELFQKQKAKYNGNLNEDLSKFILLNRNYKFSNAQIWKYRIAKYFLYKLALMLRH